MSNNSQNDDNGEEYTWWNGEDLHDFFATVIQYGYDNIWIKTYVDEEERWLDVYLRDGDVLVGHYDVSHVCPPDCK